MKLVITVEVDEKTYKEAICDGWEERFGDKIHVSDIGTVDNPSDFQGAAKFLPEEAFISMEIKNK